MLRHDAAGLAVQADDCYTYRMEQGPVRLTHAEEAPQVVRGKTLLDLDIEDFDDPRTRIESKQLMRTLITYYLGGKELETRRIFKELQEL